jgi:hypothetical protein
VQIPEAQSVPAPQTLPSGQPPELAHDGEAHVPLVHTPEAQSPGAPQTFPSGQEG